HLWRKPPVCGQPLDAVASPKTERTEYLSLLREFSRDRPDCQERGPGGDRPAIFRQRSLLRIGRLLLRLATTRTVAIHTEPSDHKASRRSPGCERRAVLRKITFRFF